MMYSDAMNRVSTDGYFSVHFILLAKKFFSVEGPIWPLALKWPLNPFSEEANTNINI